ncbi:MAG: NUDIX domain-containing protein [Candidatus Sungbacteria bacterium]|nr:NUDIX domain-containing protein [Candidatus Sungbacteria bacterium]
MSESLEHAAGAVIFHTAPTKREYLLLLHHPVHNARVPLVDEEYWNFPKGHIEEGETADVAMRREILEETGIEQINILPGFEAREQYTVEIRGMKILKTVEFFLATTPQQDVRISREHRAYAWLPYDEAYARLTYQDSKRILAQADSFLASHPS